MKALILLLLALSIPAFGQLAPTPTFTPAAGTYPSAQGVTILDSLGTASTQIVTNEGSNANASNGDTPSRNFYTNCATSCNAGVWQPVNSGSVSNGQLACTTAAQSSGVANGCPARSVVGGSIAGTGTHALDNGKGAGGVDSPASMSVNYGGSTANPCAAQFSNLSTGWLGLGFTDPVAQSLVAYSITTGSGAHDTSLLAPNKNTMTQALSDAIFLYLTVSCMDINNTSAAGVHAEFDTNHTISTDDYFGFGKHFNFSTQKFYYCLQGCSGWKEMHLVEPNGTVHTTFAWPATHEIFVATLDRRDVGCTSSSGSSCEWYDFACFQDVTAGTAKFCGYWVDAVSGQTPGGIPVHKSGFTVNEINTQTQIDIDAPSVTISQNVWRTFVGFNQNGVAIYYTNDGSTPTTSKPRFGFPISVATSQTIKAIATAPAYSDSVVGVAAYVIGGGGVTYALTVTQPTGGIISGSNCLTNAALASGTPVSCSVAPASGFSSCSLSGSGSASSVSGSSESFNIAANSTVTASCAPSSITSSPYPPRGGMFAVAQ